MYRSRWPSKNLVRGIDKLLPKRYTYRTMKTVRLSDPQKCKRCGHAWYPRKSIVTICPKCKSPYWDREKRHRG